MKVSIEEIKKSEEADQDKWIEYICDVKGWANQHYMPYHRWLALKLTELELLEDKNGT